MLRTKVLDEKHFFISYVRNLLLIKAWHDSFPGSFSTRITWLRPRDDGDAVVNGYQVFVDGIPHGKILSQWTLQANVKVTIENYSCFSCA